MQVLDCNGLSRLVIICLLALLVVPLVHAGDIDVKPDSRIEVVYIHAGD